MNNYFDTKVRAYINRTCRDIRKGNMERAKKNFDEAWKAKVEYGCTWKTEDDLLWLRENWYPTKGTGAKLTEKGCYYEGKILASAGL